MMVSVILGPPGAGKTSVAMRLAAEFGLAHLSSGDLLRRMSTGSGLQAQRLRELLAAGVPPDDIARAAVLAALATGPHGNATLLDGFPRTLEQATVLDGYLRTRGAQVSVLLYLAVSERTAAGRLRNRRICPTCGPLPATPTSERCGVCGGPVERRWADAEPAALHERRAVFYRDSTAVLDHYCEAGRLVTIDAEDPPDRVFAAASVALSRFAGLARSAR